MSNLSHLDRIIALALAEDIGQGDVTTDATVPARALGRAEVIAKQPLVLAGLDVFARVYRQVDRRVAVVTELTDGAEVAAGAIALRLDGPTRALLTGERVALNFLMHLSGVATWTRRLRAAIADRPQVKLLDTRKTLPGLRALEKAAVVAGGGANHRHGLFDGVLIKENHILAAGSIGAAIERARRHAHHLLRVQCEVTNLDELDQALAAGADALLLDNMDQALLRQAVQRSRERRPEVFLEASGNMTAERLPLVAATGVDGISVGGLTHSAPAVDLSLLLRPGVSV
ncbi:MAG: carboxylating nicotinate-nucleotide diphosphorylase [Deltaproteobacteria bacterium]|nr:carboxylating nicotinate-nucleotide diphosphorylase [Deltaproteobacteria bacterium]